MGRRKVYVEVQVCFDKDGKMIPEALMWINGRIYTIDRILNITPAEGTKNGDRGDKYTILVHGKKSCLYFEPCITIVGSCYGKWFVEEKCQ